MHYFAYGSNMNWQQMQRRCPSSLFVSVARLTDYQFGITRHSRLRDCGTANIFRALGKEVWGILYDVTDADLVTLDTFEDGYRREIIPVHPLGNGAEPHQALIYVAKVEPDVPLPNPEYKRLILEGARHWGLPNVYVSFLAALQTSADS